MKLTLACNVNVADVFLAVVLILGSIVPIFCCSMHTKKVCLFLTFFLCDFFSFLPFLIFLVEKLYVFIYLSVYQSSNHFLLELLSL